MLARSSARAAPLMLFARRARRPAAPQFQTILGEMIDELTGHVAVEHVRACRIRPASVRCLPPYELPGSPVHSIPILRRPGDSVQPGCCGTPSSQKWDDVAMIIAVKKDIASKVSISKFYYTGLSNGSYMGHRFLCEAPDEFDAYAITASALSESWDDCEPANSKPVLYLHGRYDRIQPIEGSNNVAGEYTLSAIDTMDIYAERNDCEDFPDLFKTTIKSGANWCRKYTGCSESLVYCEVESRHVPYGTPGIDVARIFWEFLSRH